MAYITTRDYRLVASYTPLRPIRQIEVGGIFGNICPWEISFEKLLGIC